MKRLALSLTMAMVAISVQAQTYAEIGYVSMSYEKQGSVLGYNASVDASPTAVRGIFGYEVNPNLSVEGLFTSGLGNANASIVVGSTAVPGATLKVDAIYGLYVKPKTMLTPNLEGFFRIGYANASASSTYQGKSSSSSGSTPSAGLGLSYTFDNKMSANLDYMIYHDKDSVGAKLSGFAIGLGYKF